MHKRIGNEKLLSMYEAIHYEREPARKPNKTSRAAPLKIEQHRYRRVSAARVRLLSKKFAGTRLGSFIKSGNGRARFAYLPLDKELGMSLVSPVQLVNDNSRRDHFAPSRGHFLPRLSYFSPLARVFPRHGSFKSPLFS